MGPFIPPDSRSHFAYNFSQKIVVYCMYYSIKHATNLYYMCLDLILFGKTG
jgi:hypothetical protein